MRIRVDRFRVVFEMVILRREESFEGSHKLVLLVSREIRTEIDTTRNELKR